MAVLLAVLFGCAVAPGALAIVLQTESDLQSLFEQAQQAAHQGNYDRAEQLYRQIVSQDANLLAARVNLGLAYYWQGKKDQALGTFAVALRQQPQEYTALLFSGLIDLEKGLYDQAAERLDSAHKIKQDDPLLLWAMGSLAMIHGNAKIAVPYLQRSFQLNPQNPRVVWLLGVAYAQLAYRQKESSSISAHYQQLANEHLKWMKQHQPNSPLLHVFRGDVYSARKATLPALQEYRIALKMDPDWPDLHLLIGSLEEVLNRWGDAQQELQMQLKQNPGDTRALVELGVVLTRTGCNQEAVKVLDRAIQRDRQNYKAEFRLGQAYLNLDENTLAVQHLQRATELEPHEGQPYYLLFKAYRALKEKDKAAQALKLFNQCQTKGSPG
jgi:tetratricopeptide (TPR) repeat protein